MRLRLTVLGKSPAHQDAGGATSGYLIEDDATCLLMDCGNGVFGKLRARHDYFSIDAVVISHCHADHWFDLVPFAIALLFSQRHKTGALVDGPVVAPVRPKVYVPPGAIESFRTVNEILGDSTLFDRAFDFCEYELDGDVTVGTLTLKFQPVPHYIPANAIDVRSTSGARLTYGADCAPNSELERFAQDTDFLILEATLLEPEPDDQETKGHMTPTQAGELARVARAKRLLITHYSDEIDPNWVHDGVAKAFGGKVELAQEGAEFVL